MGRPKSKAAPKPKPKARPKGQAVNSTPNKAPSCHLDDLDDEGLSIKKVSRSALSWPQFINKKILDNFPGWASEQTDGHIVGGLSLRGRLDKDFQMKARRRLGEEQMRARSMCIDISTLFTEGPADRKRKRLLQKLDVLDKRRPHTISGIHFERVL